MEKIAAIKNTLLGMLAAAATLGIFLSADNLEKNDFAKYEFAKSQPINVGAIKKTANAYILLKLRFRADSIEGHPNVFQTAPVNDGIRMEISGSTAALNFPDTSLPGGLRGLVLTTNLKVGQWYDLKIEALNGAFVAAELKGKNPNDYSSVSYASRNLFVDTSKILVGGGFDATRAFQGEIENISILKGNAANTFWLYVFTAALLVTIFFLFKDCKHGGYVRTHLEKLVGGGGLATYISIMVIMVFGVTLFTLYYFPIYPDEIQVRFWLSRLFYDFPEKISGAPTCLSTFIQPIPATMYLPGVIDWLWHGNIENIQSLRMVGIITALVLLGWLTFYLIAKSGSSNELSGEKKRSIPRLHVAGLVIALFSVGVFPFFLVTNRGEQLIIPSVILLIGIFLASSELGGKAKVIHKIGLIVLYFIAVSLILYAHPKGLFLSPLFVIVGWQIFSHFRTRWPFIVGMALVGVHIYQDIAALKYAFKCSEVPQFESMLKSFSFDPLSLLYDPEGFFVQVSNSWHNSTKYFQQLGFQEQTDINYLPAQPLNNFSVLANFLISLNILAVLAALLVLIPIRYYREDLVKGIYVSTNFVLLVLMGCALASATFNLPKNWYDAGYLYSILLIVLIFFVGENFSGIFQRSATRAIISYLGLVAILSQSVLIHRNLGEFLNGYAGPSVSIKKYDSAKTERDLNLASRACNIDPALSKRVVVDDFTYLHFQKSQWPMAITYIRAGNDDISIRSFFTKVDSDGLVVNCASMPVSYMPLARREGNICCISKDELKNLSSLP